MSLSTDLIDLKLTVGHDIEITNGDVVLTSGLDGVAQDVEIACKMIAGEWFEDLDEGIALWVRDGIPVTRAILGQKFDRNKAISEYSRAILSIPEVTSILAIDVSFDTSTRTLRMNYEAQTTFGDTVADSLAFTGGSNG